MSVAAALILPRIWGNALTKNWGNMFDQKLGEIDFTNDWGNRFYQLLGTKDLTKTVMGMIRQPKGIGYIRFHILCVKKIPNCAGWANIAQ